MPGEQCVMIHPYAGNYIYDHETFFGLIELIFGVPMGITVKLGYDYSDHEAYIAIIVRDPRFRSTIGEALRVDESDVDKLLDLIEELLQTSIVLKCMEYED